MVVFFCIQFTEVDMSIKNSLELMTDLAAEFLVVLTFICFDQYQARPRSRLLSYWVLVDSSKMSVTMSVRASEFLVIEINRRHHHMIQTMNAKDKK